MCSRFQQQQEAVAVRTMCPVSPWVSCMRSSTAACVLSCCRVLCMAAALASTRPGSWIRVVCVLNQSNLYLGHSFLRVGCVNAARLLTPQGVFRIWLQRVFERCALLLVVFFPGLFTHVWCAPFTPARLCIISSRDVSYNGL